MEKIRFMVVSGFLGAGKTTTMIALAEHMNKTYGEAAIIANDLGYTYIYSTSRRRRAARWPKSPRAASATRWTTPSTRSAACATRDGAVFVMSDIPGCGVGALDHVYHRLARENADEFTLSPFTVVVDPERLRMIMPERADIHLPEELVYLLKLQLEEADLVVLNKADLLSPEDVARYVDFLHTACPDIPVLVISALERTGIAELAEFVTTHETALKNFSVRDNQEFADAEAKLTWYNRRLYLKTNDGSKIDCNAVVDDLIEGIRMGLIEKKRNVPHLKTFATSGNGDFNKASLIGVDYDVEYAQQFLRPHKNLRMIVNARAVCESRPLARLMDDALDEVCEKYDLGLPSVLHGMLRHGRRGKVGTGGRQAAGPGQRHGSPVGPGGGSYSNSPVLARNVHWTFRLVRNSVRTPARPHRRVTPSTARKAHATLQTQGSLMEFDESQDIRELVRTYYGQTLQGVGRPQDRRLLLHHRHAAEVRAGRHGRHRGRHHGALLRLRVPHSAGAFRRHGAGLGVRHRARRVRVLEAGRTHRPRDRRGT